jgi:hypothetical protein
MLVPAVSEMPQRTVTLSICRVATASREKLDIVQEIRMRHLYRTRPAFLDVRFVFDQLPELLIPGLQAVGLVN